MLCDMDLDIKIKEEAVWLEGTANTSPTDGLSGKMNGNTTVKCEQSLEEEKEVFPLTNFHLLSEMTHLKEETKTELSEQKPTQENAFKPSADIKNEIFIEEHAVDQSFTCSKEENNLENAVGLTCGVVHSCRICHKTFNKSSNLNRHFRTHTGERPYSCSICGSSFADQSHLKTHHKTHSKDKPFKCFICGGTFTTSSNLKIHAVTHSEKRPFSCSICGNTFKRSHDLRNHEKQHADNRPSSSNKGFNCSICGNTFRWASNFREHKLLHTVNSPFSCSLCGHTFKRFCSLRRHEKKHRW